MATYKQISYLEALLKKNVDLVETVYKLGGMDFSREEIEEDRRGMLRLAEESTSKQCSAAIGEFIRVNEDLTSTLKKAGVHPVSLKKIGHDLEEGFYSEYITNSRGEETIRVWKAQMSQTGNLYVKMLSDSGKWAYAPGKKNHVAENCKKLDIETAKKYGKLYGRCASCGRTLTNEESIEFGMGPICRKSFM